MELLILGTRDAHHLLLSRLPFFLLLGQSCHLLLIVLAQLVLLQVGLQSGNIGLNHFMLWEERYLDSVCSFAVLLLPQFKLFHL